MTPEIRDKLALELMRDNPWPVLRPHYERGAMILVKEISLIDAGAAFASDDVDQIKAWLADGTLFHPTPIDVDHWETVITLFAALIVQPYVLAQVEKAPPGEN